MRPLELRLSGFRSYRAERVVAFRDLDLLAIIGDTGAGKSSLLEAITWALYGASTWSKKANTDLLAHGARRMSVALEFEAAGERWRVTRTFARSGAPSAQLECLSDGAIAKVDGVRQVDPEVERVLGLSYDVFCSCVLLPQGKFERLLKATKGEKTDTLKSILRLEQLGEVREIAERYAAQLAHRERDLLVARGRFRPDPRADVAAASATLDTVVPEHDRLTAVAARADELAALAREHAASAAAARAEAERLNARRGTRAHDLRALAARAGQLGTERASAREAASAADMELRGANAAHEEALAAGTDAASVARHQATLVGARAALGRRAGAMTRRAEAEGDLASARRAESDARAALEAATHTLAEHDGAHRAAEQRVATAAGARDAAQAAADALRAAEVAQAGAREALDDAERALADAERRQAAAHEAVAEARNAHARAQHDRDEVLRRDAAAHAAAGCAAGDPCPVCARSLPDDFIAPVIPDLDSAAAVVDRTAVALDGAMEAERTAALVAAGAAQGRDAAKDRVAETARVTATARESARALAGVAAAEDPLVALDAAVAGSVAAVALAESEIATLVANRPDKEAEHTRCAGAIAAASADVRNASRAIEQGDADIAAIDAELAAAVAALPTYCAMPDAGEVDRTRLDAAARGLAARLEDAEALDRRRADASAVANDATTRLHEVELAFQREVATPVAEARIALWTLAAELPADERSDLAEPSADTGPAELAALADDVERRVDTRMDALREAASVAAAAEGRAAGDASGVVTGAGFADRAAVADRLTELGADILAAKRERDAAQRQVAGAARLDELVSRAGEFRQGFEALKDALADRAFVGFVVARRQRALLAHASKVLEDITERYAFTDDFRILDRESGLPRSPDTLSGGETFIASLALALGLVEVADRSGGDLRALFLDEGFGSLDAAILDTALTALEERAKAGRLIGLISHVPTVAERIDTVLEIRNGVEGSSIHLLSADERDERVADRFAGAAGAV